MLPSIKYVQCASCATNSSIVLVAASWPATAFVCLCYGQEVGHARNSGRCFMKRRQLPPTGAISGRSLAFIAVQQV